MPKFTKATVLLIPVFASFILAACSGGVEISSSDTAAPFSLGSAEASPPERSVATEPPALPSGTSSRTASVSAPKSGAASSDDSVLLQESQEIAPKSEKSGTGLEHTGTLFGRSLYAVWDEAGLRELASSYEDDAIYTMQNDIQLSAEEWIPIGTEEKPFRGWFTGNAHTISGLTMSDPDAEAIGLFGWASGALITDLTLRDVDMSRAGRNVADENKKVDAICAVRSGECRIGVTEVYPKGSDVNTAPELTAEEKTGLESYINQVLSGNED